MQLPIIKEILLYEEVTQNQIFLRLGCKDRQKGKGKISAFAILSLISPEIVLMGICRGRVEMSSEKLILFHAIPCVLLPSSPPMLTPCILGVSVPEFSRTHRVTVVVRTSEIQ